MKRLKLETSLELSDGLISKSVRMRNHDDAQLSQTRDVQPKHTLED